MTAGDDPPARVDLLLPDLGLADVPVLASLWLVEVGSDVTQGDRLLEIVAGDVTIDLPAPATGTLVELLVAEDDVLTVGQRLGVIESE